MTTVRIHYFQHVPFEPPGYIHTWAHQNCFNESWTKFFEGQPLPNAASFDWLIVMGGPMGVYDTDLHPWLESEKIFIRQCITEGKTVIGICLGAQLIAAALHARVYPNSNKEIGWWPVQLTEEGKNCPLLQDIPDNSRVLHWHGDTFDLPAGATRLASSEICCNQAFIYRERVLAFQFHFETTPATLKAMTTHCQHELVEAPYIQPVAEIVNGAERYADDNNKWLAYILNRLAFNKV